MKAFVCLVFVMSSISLFSQNKLSEKYVMRPRENDIIYFILPFEVPCAERYDNASMDVTYITSESKLTVNMSIKTPYILQIDSMSICSGIHYPVENLVVLFLEKEKRQWLHRISFRLDYDVWKKLYQAKQPYDILVYTSGHMFQYAFPEKRWLAECMWMSELFKMIEYKK